MRGSDRRRTLVVVAISLTSLGAQVTLRLPGDTGTYGSWYGEPVDVTLGSLAHELGALQGQAVRVRGRLESLEIASLRLREGGASVLLLPVSELRDAPLHTLLGRQVEVVGVARRLIEQQAMVPCWETESVPESWCEDPELPPLPDRQGHLTWPRNSLTFWGIVDATPGASTNPGSSRSTLAAIAEDPAGFDGQKVTVRGQFRGRNLFLDLPASTMLDRNDWVVSDGVAAIWVTGKAPRGDGWRLSLDDEGESRWWIEIQGRVEVRDGVPFIQPTKLRLTRPPGG